MAEACFEAIDGLCAYLTPAARWWQWVSIQTLSTAKAKKLPKPAELHQMIESSIRLVHLPAGFQVVDGLPSFHVVPNSYAMNLSSVRPSTPEKLSVVQEEP